MLADCKEHGKDAHVKYRAYVLDDGIHSPMVCTVFDTVTFHYILHNLCTLVCSIHQLCYAQCYCMIASSVCTTAATVLHVQSAYVHVYIDNYFCCHGCTDS
jgi:hypothetical protein